MPIRSFSVSATASPRELYEESEELGLSGLQERYSELDSLAGEHTCSFMAAFDGPDT